MPETELNLDEMLADPMVRLVMRRDGVEEAELRALLDRAKERLWRDGRLALASRVQPAFGGSAAVPREACLA